ncbi:MAG: LacI family DNA-binding transcriptional regulator [Phycisphaeraceae bacterium JB051]
MTTQTCNSIYDLAQQTGVSVGTVSRVLNQRGRVADATRQRVLEAARAANFKPRMSARNLTVAVVTDRVGAMPYGGYVSHLMSPMIEALAEHDVSVELYTEHNAANLGNRFVDGVLAMAWSDSTIQKLHEQLGKVPVVFINRLDLDEFSVVGTDQKAGAAAVAEHLLSHGHRDICIATESKSWGFEQRVAGLREQMQKQGIDPDEHLQMSLRIDEHESLSDQLSRAVSRKPSALFLASEDIVFQATHHIQNTLGMVIGKDISVVGMELPEISAFMSPPQTALRQPLRQIGSEAVNLLMKHIADNRFTPQQVLLESHLIQRQSVCEM